MFISFSCGEDDMVNPMPSQAHILLLRSLLARNPCAPTGDGHFPTGVCLFTTNHDSTWPHQIIVASPRPPILIDAELGEFVTFDRPHLVECDFVTWATL